MKNLTSKLVVPVVILLTSVVMQSCTDGKSADRVVPTGSDPIPVKVMPLEKTSRASVVTASGQLTTDDETLLAFKTGGVVDAVYVKEGDQVRKGQVLARLDLTEIDALVAQAKYAYEKELRDLKRVTNLYSDSVATLEQLQNSQTAVAVAREKLEAATFNRSFSEIHAPANGYVLRKFVNAGRVVNVGDPILLTNAAVLGKWILKVGVSDQEWAMIKAGDSATVKIDALPQREFYAKVCRMSETSDPTTGAFTVELLFSSDGEKLATGMFGATTLHLNKKVSAWSVPYEAVLDANGDEGFVFIAVDNKIAKKMPVTIASFNGKSIRISTGLEDAEALIISGSAYLRDDSSIRIIK